MSLFVFLGALMTVPVIEVVALFRRRRVADQEQSIQPREWFPGWLTRLLVWLAALLGVLALLGMVFIIVPLTPKDFSFVPENLLTELLSQYPALIYGRLPHFNPVLPWYVQVWLSLPFAIFFLAAIAGVGTRQAWRSRRETARARGQRRAARR